MLDALVELGASADACGVDGKAGAPVKVEADIDGVSGGACDFADDAAFFSGEGVDEGAFAGVATADEGHFHLGCGFSAGGFAGLGDGGEEALAEVSAEIIGDGGDKPGLAEPEGSGLVPEGFPVFGVDFVGDDAHGDSVAVLAAE